MSLNRSQKQDLISHYAEGLGGAQHAFLVDYKGITVNEDTELRAKVRGTGGSYEVVKNTLAKQAIDGKAMGQLGEYFQGPTAVAYIPDDPVGLAKALTEFAKDVPALEFKGGLVDGQAVDADAIQDIAKMPGREELVAKLVFLLQSPISRFVRCLGALPQQLVVALDQIAKKK